MFSTVWIYYCFLRKTYSNTRGLFCRFKLSCTKRDLGSILFINHITTYLDAFMIEKTHPFVILVIYLILFRYLVTHKNISPQNTAIYKNYFNIDISSIHQVWVSNLSFFHSFLSINLQGSFRMKKRPYCWIKSTGIPCLVRFTGPGFVRFFKFSNLQFFVE